MKTSLQDNKMYYEIKIYKNGDKEWYINGRRHREDGPAVEFTNGFRSWYLNGVRLTKETWFENISGDLKIKVLFNKDFIK